MPLHTCMAIRACLRCRLHRIRRTGYHRRNVFDTLLASHLLVQLGRIAAAGFLFAVLFALGARAIELARIVIADPVEHLLLSIATGFAIYQFVVRVLGELPLLSPAGVWILVVALGLIASFGRMRVRIGELAAIRIPFDWRTVVISVLLLAPLTMALAPAVSLDAMIYHLRFPEMTLAQGSWAYDPASSDSFYPSATGTLYLPMLAIDDEGIGAQLMHFGFFVLSIVAIGAIAKRIGRDRGTTAALLFAALPAAGVIAGWAWADLSLLFALAASVLATLTGLPALALLLLGLAASIKYTALLAGLPIALFVLAQAARRKEWKPILAGLLLGALAMGPWYITNAIRTGNPVYPLAGSIFGTESGALDAHLRWSRNGNATVFQTWADYFLRPATIDDDIGGVLFLLLAAIGIAGASRDSRLRWTAIAVVAMWLVFLPFTPAMRLLLPAVAATLLLAGVVLERVRWRIAAAVLTTLFVVRGGLVVAAHDAYFLNPLPAAVGIEKESEYLRRNFAPAALYSRAKRELPASARVVAINEVRLFRFPRPIRAARFYELPALLPYVARANSPEQLLERLQEDRVTHLLIALEPVERGHTVPLGAKGDRLVTGLLRLSRVVDREGSTLLVELPSRR